MITPRLYFFLVNACVSYRSSVRFARLIIVSFSFFPLYLSICISLALALSLSSLYQQNKTKQNKTKQII